MTFDIRERNGEGDGWTGVSADTIDGARLACVTIAGEGFGLPLDIIPEDSDYAVESLTGLDGDGGGIWQTSSLVRQYDGRAAA